MNERGAAEMLLKHGYYQNNLVISFDNIRRACVKYDINIEAVITLLKPYADVHMKGVGRIDILAYKLNNDGVNFVLAGCWSGIENIELEKIKKENIEKDNEIKRMQKEKSKDRRVTILAAIVGAVLGAIITAVAGHFIK